ncbi:MAG: N-acetylmuramoyl-L-alanine amidase, partial [Bacteroidales bacterium]|nr:N-acetylmuramoyl-L-alanine amidase [Bacteroidales bacterium]
MNKNRFKSLGVLQILCLLLLTSNALGQGYGVKTIVIDPGHGGTDPGAIGRNSKEKDIVLKVALLTGKYIEDYLDDVE